MAGKIFGNAVKEPGRIFEAATSGSSFPAARPAAVFKPQPVVNIATREQEEINRLSKQIKGEENPAPKQPERRDVEAEITQVRREKKTVEEDKQEEEFLRKLQEERKKEQQEAKTDAQEIIPQSKPSRGSALSPKAVGTKEMAKRRR